MDIFMEKIVARKKTIIDIFIIVALITAVPVVFITITSIPLIVKYLGGMWLLIFAGLIYGAFHLIRSRSIEYEYIVTNQDLDIDKIIAQRKRKRIFSAKCTGFEILAKYQGGHYDSSYDSIKKRIDAVSSMDSKDVYFIVLNYQGEQTIVFFEPNERMIESFRKFIPRKVFI